MGILKGFATFEKKFLDEFENDNFRIGSIKQAILPLDDTESPFYIPIYKQELPVSDAEGYVTLTYKHIYEWHQYTAAAAVVLGYKGVMAGGAAGAETLRRLLEKIPVLNRPGLPQTMK